ncbi:TetR family transcriptional regulator [Nocardia stercoris]|uniref:TetR family transcriptional regulator n=1 Tax=Nocardia stercoris TaxID=2483361 RepID=A0A3M2L447_9NOCA|nr:TetR family transcriptional regulator [Nocardia stercoris]RMI32331.1 TetR family transcriptional regulator [Nocardia stercoris]
MGRWVPDSQGRLIKAAIELFTEYGFDQTTVAQIAAHAGVTQRTFFRYFADKREVLFWGQQKLDSLLVAALEAVPEDVEPLDAAVEAVKSAGAVFGDEPEGPRLRNQVIAANTELRERELLKVAMLAESLAATLSRRDVDPDTARLAAQTAVTVFAVAFAHWIDEDAPRQFATVVDETYRNLKALTATAGVGSA